MSKSGWNKDREVNVSISGNLRRKLVNVRVASIDMYNGVKVCALDLCDYVAPVSAQRPCSIHNSHKLIESNVKEPFPV